MMLWGTGAATAIPTASGRLGFDIAVYRLLGPVGGAIGPGDDVNQLGRVQPARQRQ